MNDYLSDLSDSERLIKLAFDLSELQLAIQKEKILFQIQLKIDGFLKFIYLFLSSGI